MKYVVRQKHDANYVSGKHVWNEKTKGYDYVEVPPIHFADVTETIRLTGDGECVQDLQHGNIYCYMAMAHRVDGGTWILLIGNGWGEKLGYPWNEERQCYVVFGGASAQKFIDTANDDCFAEWKDVYSGDASDLRVLEASDEET